MLGKVGLWTSLVPWLAYVAVLVLRPGWGSPVGALAGAYFFGLPPVLRGDL